MTNSSLYMLNKPNPNNALSKKKHALTGYLLRQEHQDNIVYLQAEGWVKPSDVSVGWHGGNDGIVWNLVNLQTEKLVNLQIKLTAESVGKTKWSWNPNLRSPRTTVAVITKW